MKNRLLHLQYDNEMSASGALITRRKELRFALEKKDKELQERAAQIQQLQAQAVEVVATVNG